MADDWDVSSLYETDPVGGPDQDPYLNAVMVADSANEPHDLLVSLQRIESDHGRERGVRWGPRTLDLDIVASDGPPVADEGLEIPHPRARERRFVLEPLSELWPGADVGQGITAAHALTEVGDQRVDRLARDWLSPKSWVGQSLVAGQLVIMAATAVVLYMDGTLPDGELGLVRLVGGLLAVLGAGLAIISSRRLGPALSAIPVPRPDTEMVDTGPYRLARHPIYGGVTMLMTGAALFLDSLPGFAVSVLLLPYFLLKSGYEERQLRIRFPSYRHYRERVRHRLIPFLI